MASSKVGFEPYLIDYIRRRVDTLQETLKGRGMDEDRVWLLGSAGSEQEIPMRGQP